jgi:CDGSH-type Zn-finger protein
MAVVITPSADGPYLVSGPVNIEWPSGHKLSATDPVALCRCGHSNDKPFCDGTHAKIGFKSREDDATAHKG